MSNEKLKQEIIKEAGRIEECCEYSAKAHYNTSKEWNICHLCLNIPIAILSAVVVYVPCEFKTYPAVLTAILAAIQMCTKPIDCLSIHKLAADRYLELKNRVRRFKNIEIETFTIENALNEINKFGTLLDAYNTDNPMPSRFGYKKAKAGINNGETQFRVDEEEIK